MLAAMVSAKVTLGVKGGYSVYNIDDNVLKPANTCGFYVGPTLKFKLPIIRLGMDISAIYEQRDVNFDPMIITGSTPESDYIFEPSVTRKTFAIPVNVRFNIIGAGDIANLFIYTGPQFSFTVGEDRVTFDNVDDITSDWTLRSSTFSWNVGVGITFATHFQINANYNAAIGRTGDQKGVNVGEVVTDEISKMFKAGNSNIWQIGVAYYF